MINLVFDSAIIFTGREISFLCVDIKIFRQGKIILGHDTNLATETKVRKILTDNYVTNCRYSGESIKLGLDA